MKLLALLSERTWAISKKNLEANIMNKSSALQKKVIPNWKCYKKQKKALEREAWGGLT